jgi:fructoselysine 6-kinase
MQIVAVGECTLDRYLDLNRTYVGGISLNFAVHARRCGAQRVALVTRTGDDPEASLIRAALTAEGVDQSHVGALPGPTAHQDVRLLAGGERLFPPGGYSEGVLRDFTLTPDDLAFIRTFDVVAAPYFRQVAHLFEATIGDPTLHARRVADFLDGDEAADRIEGMIAWLDRLDIAFISGERALVERLRPYAANSRALVVVTHGSAGSTALMGGEEFFQPAAPAAELRDSTGCGDAFQAAFTVAHFGGARVPDALARAAAHAAQVIAHYGAIGS